MTNKTKQKDETVIIEEMADVASTATTKVAEGAREFVRRSAVGAKERADDLYENSEKFNSGLENALTRVAGGYVSILGGIAAATHDNVNHALTTVEKLANAESVSEAVRIQSDYVRENTSANLARVRDAAETIREVAGDSAGMVRENVSKIWPYGKKAA